MIRDREKLLKVVAFLNPRYSTGIGDDAWIAEAVRRLCDLLQVRPSEIRDSSGLSPGRAREHLDMGLNWSSTPQGHSYWNGVAMQIVCLDNIPTPKVPFVYDRAKDMEM